MIRRLLLSFVVLALAVPMAVPVTSHAYTPTNAERYAQSQINSVRRNYGKRALSLSASMSYCAHRHSARMASRRTLYHSNCSNQRENVGYGTTMSQIVRMWLNSPAHRRNVLCTCSRIAVGVVRVGSYYWITEMYW